MALDDMEIDVGKEATRSADEAPEIFEGRRRPRADG